MAVRARLRPAVVLWTLTALFVVGHLIWPTGPMGNTTYHTVNSAGPLVAPQGARTAPPRRRRVPMLLTTGLAASAVGDVAWLAYTLAGREPDASWADVAYYSAYVFLVAATLAVALGGRHDARRFNIDAAVDALTVVVVAVLLLWSVAVRGIITDTSVPVSTRVVLAGYPVLDAILLALVLRLLSVREHREALGLLFPLGVGCWLASDFGYMLPWTSDMFAALLDVGWMAGGILMATSTWRRPSGSPPVEPARPVRAPVGQLGLGWMGEARSVRAAFAAGGAAVATVVPLVAWVRRLGSPADAIHEHRAGADAACAASGLPRVSTVDHPSVRDAEPEPTGS